KSEQPAAPARPAAASAPAPSAPAPSAPAPRPASAVIPGDVVPMSHMRKLIAKHMIESRRTSAHVHCMYEVDLTRIVQLRNKQKSGLGTGRGAGLIFMRFFVRAAISALQRWPIINASWDGDNFRSHGHVNGGIGVALDGGLLVPVLKSADELIFLG